jgi:hypothetical protein
MCDPDQIGPHREPIRNASRPIEHQRPRLNPYPVKRYPAAALRSNIKGTDLKYQRSNRIHPITDRRLTLIREGVCGNMISVVHSASTVLIQQNEEAFPAWSPPSGKGSTGQTRSSSLQRHQLAASQRFTAELRPPTVAPQPERAPRPPAVDSAIPGHRSSTRKHQIRVVYSDKDLQPALDSERLPGRWQPPLFCGDGRIGWWGGEFLGRQLGWKGMEAALDFNSSRRRARAEVHHMTVQAPRHGFRRTACRSFPQPLVFLHEGWWGARPRIIYPRIEH